MHDATSDGFTEEPSWQDGIVNMKILQNRMVLFMCSVLIGTYPYPNPKMPQAVREVAAKVLIVEFWI